MIRKLSTSEWDTSQLSSDRQAYLSSHLALESIAQQVFAEKQIVGARIKSYKSPPREESKLAKDARQIMFELRVSQKTCDLLYNGPDGLRARYWQSPDYGFLATQHLISGLLPELITFAKINPPWLSENATTMSIADIGASLKAPSAKIWPREWDDMGNRLFLRDHLVVPRWERNEQFDQFHKGEWRNSPREGELEIKGALLGPDRTEFIPEGKRDRSCQIHRFGFT